MANEDREKENGLENFWKSSTISSESSQSQGVVTPKELMDHFKWILGVIILFIVVTILVLVVDIWRDNSLHDKVSRLENEVNSFRNEVQKSIDTQIITDDNLKQYKQLLDKQQKILDCLSYNKYWQYERCLK